MVTIGANDNYISRVLANGFTLFFSDSQNSVTAICAVCHFFEKQLIEIKRGFRFVEKAAAKAH
ncbi:hypothetical protein [Neisseria perflava]|uniref:hypothetical protein n=1 Tax=Neisseria perflava TaxID=33053 RepID=UPI00209F7611|nr:hypothetical protein [Neisseria perflava]MCP1660786.1 cytochrome c553 [Neisseria perflava]MCP1773301.1 cytochrome c553 [Neisseria perflava]